MALKKLLTALLLLATTLPAAAQVSNSSIPLWLDTGNVFRRTGVAFPLPVTASSSGASQAFAAATAAAPSYTEGTNNILSQTLAGQLRVLASQLGTWTVQPGNTANTTAWLVTGTGGTFPVTQTTSPWVVSNSGTFAVQATLQAGTALAGKFGIDQTTPGTTNGVQVNAALPAGTNVIGHVIVDTAPTTSVTQGTSPWVVSGGGTAGSAASGVVSVQGIASMTPLLATLGAETTKVIGTVNQGTSPWVISGAVTNAGTFAVQSAQSGTWTVQPGNTANTTAWLVTGTGGTFPATQSGTWTVQPGNTANTTPWLATISQGGNSTLVSSAGAIASNIAQVAGATVATGAGTAAGALRVELPTNGTGVIGLNAGTALIGKVGIDQTTPGTTNAVAPISGQTGVAGNTGVVGATTQRVTLATDVALPAGTNLLGKTGIDQTTLGTTNGVNIVPSNSSAIGITSVVSTAAEGSHVLLGTAGNFYGGYVTAGATSGYLMVFNATSAPADGAVTPIHCVVVPANTTISINNGDIPGVYSTGITAVFSSTGCFTKTVSNTAFFHGRVK